MLQNQRGYGLGSPLQTLAPVPFGIVGVPSKTNVPFGQLVQNESTRTWYINNGNGTYSAISTSSAGVLSVSQGGTGATTLTGVLIGNGTSAITAQGPLGVANGGTGVATLTGIPLFAGTAAATAIAFTPSTAWVPNLQINGVNTGITYASQTGFYSQVGNLVFITAEIVLTNKGAQVGNATISNLPVITGAAGSTNTLSLYGSSITLTANYTCTQLDLANASTVGAIFMSGSGQVTAAVTGAMLSNTSIINFSGVYFIN